MTWLCSLAVFVSAFLLFGVQPMVAKMLLPSLGGSPSVWNTAMVFYQGALLLGYLYAHGLSGIKSRRLQWVFHSVALLLPFLVLPLAYGELKPPATGNPSLWMLSTMALSVGLPFVVLSATSPLIQAWFARSGGGDPYFLYAASNVGSFAGLFAYPLWIEPSFGVTDQSQTWTRGYGILVLLMGLAIASLVRGGGTASSEDVGEDEAISWSRRLKWIFLAFVPSSQFIGTTTYLTTDIAVMPLLWVIPLGIYLLTMIMVFARKPLIPHAWIVRVFPFALAGLTYLTVAQVANFRMVSFGAHLAMLLIGGLLCHGELAADRPKPRRLTEFFLWMSVGGVLGGIFNALVAPVLFVRVFEYAVVLTLSAFALPKRSTQRSSLATAWDLALPVTLATAVMFVSWVYDTRQAVPYAAIGIAVGVACLIASIFFAKRPLRFAIAIGLLSAFGMHRSLSGQDMLFMGRSFFGVYRVERWNDRHNLVHGRILHGEQIFNPDLETVPLSYYHPLGPLKEMVGDWVRPEGARIAAVGLGTGTLALWSRPKEHWTFFEIDPLVERIARDPKLFTCLQKAKGKVDVTIGDARLRLQESRDQFDMIFLDAFSSDAIPVHLMTLEAFRTYGQRLSPRGTVAVHISNKFLSLEPLVYAIAQRLGWRAYVCDESTEPVWGAMLRGRTEASWMIVGPADRDYSVYAASGRWRLAKGSASVTAWTDSYSSLMPVLRKSAFKLR